LHLKTFKNLYSLRFPLYYLHALPSGANEAQVQGTNEVMECLQNTHTRTHTHTHTNEVGEGVPRVYQSYV
jgi:hypothetical protein